MSDFDGFDFNIDDAGSDNTAIPKGDYPCVVTTCEKKKSQAGNDMIWLEVEITGDNYAGWMLRKPFMLWSENQEHLGYAKADWARLCKALGFGNENPPKSAHDLHQKAFIVSVVVEEAEEELEIEEEPIETETSVVENKDKREEQLNIVAQIDVMART